MTCKHKNTKAVFFLYAEFSYALKKTCMEVAMREVLIVATVVLAGCAPGNPLPLVELTPPIEASAMDAVRRELKDPQSAQFERLRAGQDKDGSTLVCGYVNAKNGFGGYVGRKLFAARVASSGLASVEALANEGYAMGWCHRHNLMPA